MSVAARLRKLEEKPIECGCGEFTVRFSVDPLWPLLADLAEAAEQVAVLEYDPAKTPAQNRELHARAEAFRTALTRLAEEP